MHRFWVKNNWIYSLGMTFIVTNCIFFTRLMQAGDKGVIKAMVDIDQTIANIKGANESEV